MENLDSLSQLQSFLAANLRNQPAQNLQGNRSSSSYAPSHHQPPSVDPRRLLGNLYGPRSSSISTTALNSHNDGIMNKFLQANIIHPETRSSLNQQTLDNLLYNSSMYMAPVGNHMNNFPVVTQTTGFEAFSIPGNSNIRHTSLSIGQVSSFPTQGLPCPEPNLYNPSFQEVSRKSTMEGHSAAFNCLQMKVNQTPMFDQSQDDLGQQLRQMVQQANQEVAPLEEPQPSFPLSEDLLMTDLMELDLPLNGVPLGDPSHPTDTWLGTLSSSDAFGLNTSPGSSLHGDPSVHGKDNSLKALLQEQGAENQENRAQVQNNDQAKGSQDGAPVKLSREATYQENRVGDSTQEVQTFVGRKKQKASRMIEGLNIDESLFLHCEESNFSLNPLVFNPSFNAEKFSWEQMMHALGKIGSVRTNTPFQFPFCSLFLLFVILQNSPWDFSSTFV